MIKDVAFKEVKFKLPIPRGKTGCFDNGLLAPTEKEFDKITSQGFKPIIDDCSAGWGRIKNAVRPHTDNIGTCLVYCARGKGILYILRNREIVPCFLEKGIAVIFSDYDEHFFIAEKPVLLFVQPIKGA